jgi:hypothetical protein
MCGTKILFSRRAFRSGEPAFKGCPVSWLPPPSRGQKIRGPIYLYQLGLSDPSYICSRFYSGCTDCQQFCQNFQPVLLSTPPHYQIRNSRQQLYYFFYNFFLRRPEAARISQKTYSKPTSVSDPAQANFAFPALFQRGSTKHIQRTRVRTINHRRICARVFFILFAFFSTAVFLRQLGPK